MFRKTPLSTAKLQVIEYTGKIDLDLNLSQGNNDPSAEVGNPSKAGGISHCEKQGPW